MITAFVPYLFIFVLVVLLLVIVLTGYVKAPPDMAFIISGARKVPRILIGRAGIRIPVFERLDRLYLGQISVDIKTDTFIPTNDFINVKVDAIAKIRIRNDADGLQLAAKNFLNKPPQAIAADLQDSLQGNMREIIGTLDLKSVNTDRDSFSDQVMAKASRDMDKLGIEILSCNIQNVTDENGRIVDMGMDNTAKIKKDAASAKAQADRDVAIAQAEANKAANDARVKADTEIAMKNNELDIKRSELKKAADIKRAESDAAYEIQNQEQQKTIRAATVNAAIAQAEREAELKQKEVDVRQQELAAQIEKQADAEKYRAERAAEAELVQRQKKAEAEKYEQEKAAEARKALAEAEKYAAEQEAAGIKAKYDAEAAGIEARGKADAEAIRAKGLAEAALAQRQRDAEAVRYEQQQEAEAQKALAEAARFAAEQEAAGIRAKGEAEAAAILAKGNAEAEAMERKAEAYAKYGRAAVTQMIVEVLPDIAREVAAPMAAIDKVTVIGSDASGVGGVSGNVGAVMARLFETVQETTGLDLREVVRAETYDAKVNRNFNLSGIPEGTPVQVNVETNGGEGGAGGAWAEPGQQRGQGPA